MIFASLRIRSYDDLLTSQQTENFQEAASRRRRNIWNLALNVILIKSEAWRFKHRLGHFNAQTVPSREIPSTDGTYARRSCRSALSDVTKYAKRHRLPALREKKGGWGIKCTRRRIDAGRSVESARSRRTRRRQSRKVRATVVRSPDNAYRDPSNPLTVAGMGGLSRHSPRVTWTIKI